jgi:DNA-binding NarL/FixJ family response regulator
VVGALRIIAADDHRLVLEAIQLTFRSTPDVDVVETTHDARRVLPLVVHHQPDVALLDVRMPHMDGWQCIELLRRRRLRTAVVLFSACADDAAVEQARAARVSLVSKTADPDDLVDAVRRTAAGELVVDTGPQLRPAGQTHGLSPRELSILQALAGGHTNRAIARELGIAEQTVKFHLTNIYAKLGLPNRTRAARFALEHGLVRGGAQLAATDADRGRVMAAAS